jgi:Zn-dependent peptidase ImmA (M78 family)
MIDLNNFPELSEQKIEMRVDKLLNNYAKDSGWDYGMPVPIERIAEKYLGYDIEITNEGLFKDPEFLGGIHFDEKLIQVNGSIEDHEGRYSFTVAHELGHHCLHKEEFKKQTSGDEIMCRNTGDKPIVELQADRFAAYLLMPSKAVLKAFNLAFGSDSKPFEMNFKRKHKFGAISERVINAGGFDNVSLTAMTNRLIGMGLITGASYQSRVIPDIQINSLKGLWKSYVSIFKQGVRQIKKYTK